MASSMVCGSDEAGYGAWAGPMMVAAVLAPEGWTGPLGLTDSKKLSSNQRETLYLALTRDTSIRYHVHVTPVDEIDRHGVYTCLKNAHQTLHQELSWGVENVRCIADGNLPLQGGIESIPKADSLFPCVSAASILAKVTRDRELRSLAGSYPNYGFERHRGYGVPLHEEALRKYGPCAIHRMSYTPLHAYATKRDSVFDLIDDLPQE